jgi:hypothetical protein
LKPGFAGLGDHRVNPLLTNLPGMQKGPEDSIELSAIPFVPNGSDWADSPLRKSRLEKSFQYR